MIDLHCHILHGIDDGSQTLEDSIEMAKEAADDGISTIIATPHHRNGIYLNEKAHIIQKVEDLQLELNQRNITLRVLPGQEIHVYSELVSDLSNKQLLTLADREKYILLEFPYEHVPPSIDQLLFDIQMLGIIPIIPHPERNAKLREHPHLLYKMVKRGALCQITAGSILGKFGKEARKFSLLCIEHNLCHLIATDGHRAGKRGVMLREAYDVIANQMGSSVSLLFKKRAELVMKGEDIDVEPPIKIKQRSLLGFMKRSGA